VFDFLSPELFSFPDIESTEGRKKKMHTTQLHTSKMTLAFYWYSPGRNWAIIAFGCQPHAQRSQMVSLLPEITRDIHPLCRVHKGKAGKRQEESIMM